MNSKQKNGKMEYEPMFGIDPDTGKTKLLPLKAFAQTSSSGKLPEKKTRKMTILTPLKLTAADFEENLCKGAKIRKVDSNSVRKGLFNAPARSSLLGRPLTNRRQSLSKRSGICSTQVSQKKKNISELSPLLDMEEVEEELLTKKASLRRYPFKSPCKPNIKFTGISKNSPVFKGLEKCATPKAKDKTPLKLLDVPEILVETPDTISSNDTEFMELEALCCKNNNSYSQSPISSVCNLLEDTVLTSKRKQKKTATDNKNEINTIISNIEDILHNDMNALAQFKTNYEENLLRVCEILEKNRKDYNLLCDVQLKNKHKIYEYLKSLKSLHKIPSRSEKENNENSSLSPNNRRSLRLLKKSPLAPKNSKLIVSPVIMKSGDLRKSTLTKNLVTRSQQYEIQSPRIKKALSMYNSMRNEHSILTTPKIERKFLTDLPVSSSNVSRELSRRVQSQCLLLQDTPLHR